MADEVIVRTIDLIQELFDGCRLIDYAPPLAKYPSALDRMAGVGCFTEHTSGDFMGTEYANSGLDTYVAAILVHKVGQQLNLGQSRASVNQLKDAVRVTLLSSKSYPVQPGTKHLQLTPYAIQITDDRELTGETFTISPRNVVEFPLNSGNAWNGFTVTFNVLSENFNCG